MEAGAGQISTWAAHAPPASFIAADVGGTHARVGLVRVGHGARPAVGKFARYVCADYPDLAAILRDFIDSLGGEKVREAAIACAGYCLDGTIINTNLPWTVSLGQIRSELHLDAVEFVNDFEAVAYATPHLQEGDTVVLARGRDQADAPVLVVGPGTGLGAAVRIPAGAGHVVLATEAGQAAFAPGSDRELEVLRILRRRARHVSIEQVLSGPGLVNLHAALCELDGTPSTLDSPAAITRAALESGDPAARRTLDTFCGLLGGVLGDLVLLYGAQGGVYLAGGILPQIKTYLPGSTFVERFLDKGAMRPVLERVSVRLIDLAQLGVLGAASWYLQRRPRT
ncbi:MAG TPA: glucokinase [Rudaea sp.]|nr:glucokinase [Rudaea sp.]